MNKFTRCVILLAAIIAVVQSAWAAAPVNYYNSALGKSDEALMTALRNIIRPHTQLSYNALWNAFKTTDTDAQGYIIDMYSNCKYGPNDHGGSASQVGDGFNREHSFPKSWFDDGTPMYTDLFHLYPTDIKVNSQRSNFPFGVCAEGTRLTNGKLYGKGKLGKSTYPGYNGTVFEPDDEYKGDFARTYFYMVTCYKNELPSWSGSAQLNYGANKYKAFSTWTINMLMEWTRLDPVSEKEIKRNDAVYAIQGNRNPFIDHPELADYIWGSLQGKMWNGTGEEIKPAITAPADGSTINMGTTVEGTPLEYNITIKGEGLTRDVNLKMNDNEFFYVSKNLFTASELNSGVSLTIGFTADDKGTFIDTITLYSDEVTSMFTVTATAEKSGDEPGPGPDPILGDSITEDWEGCETGGYWIDTVTGNAFVWSFDNAGIWGDNLKHGKLVCRLGKNSNSVITMGEDFVNGASAISFWAGSYGSDADATLNVEYSINKGATWTTLGSVKATKGSLQRFLLATDVEVPVRFRIAQTTGTRVNIDDITLYAHVKELIGDVNGDGEVNIADINTVIDLALGAKADEETVRRADVNKDGEITLADINAETDIVLGI